MSVKLQPVSQERIRAAEIDEARAIQLAMMPRDPLRAGRVEFASKFRPAAEVGGDFLDFFPLDDYTLAFYLGDVVGKGLPAAMYAALVVGSLRGMHKTGTAPPAVLQALNRRLRMRIVPGRYCSVQYGMFSPATGELSFANAGLPKPIHVDGKGCRELGAGGLPSGLFEGASYDSYSARLKPGDSVVFATDGVTDARNPNGDDFGEQRLLSVCCANAREPAEMLLERIFEAVDDFAAGEPQQDDITLAVLRLS
jgi:sigma-B regulation protein RsbU (phosphoserine phosphatase)